MSQVVEKKEKEDIVRDQVWVDAYFEGGCGCSDEEEDTLVLRYDLPGVKKDKIHLHVIENGLRLVAPRDDKTDYISSYSFSCPANPKETKAHYEDGVLRVEVPYSCPNPWKDIAPVKIE